MIEHTNHSNPYPLREMIYQLMSLTFNTTKINNYQELSSFQMPYPAREMKDTSYLYLLSKLQFFFTTIFYSNPLPSEGDDGYKLWVG